jgi:RNA polymerase sigma-70 factor (ECF subfamily)
MRGRATARKSELDDAELIEQVRNGDLESLGLLFDRHEDGVARFLSRFGVPPADVDDLVQATFLQVLRAARRFEPRISVRGWLLGISAMMARRQRRSLVRMDRRTRLWATIPRGRNLMTDEALDVELRVNRAIGALSAKKREAFLLVTMEGMSGEEAALALGVPVKTIWTRLHHARRELRDLFEREDD